MSSMREQFKTSAKVETEGVWVDYGDFRVRVARAGGGNKTFLKHLERLRKPHERALATGLITDEVATKIAQEAFALGVITGWETKVDGEWKKGIDGPDNKLLPVTKDNIMATFEELPELFLDLRSHAGNIALFRDQVREAAGKN